MNRGEVWWVSLAGAKRRPFLVLTRQVAIPLLTALCCIPATSSGRGIDSEVALDEEDGMPRACVLSVDNLMSVDTHAFEKRICSLGPERMRAVCEALGYATGCR